MWILMYIHSIVFYVIKFKLYVYVNVLKLACLVYTQMSDLEWNEKTDYNTRLFLKMYYV
jgi:hypothetical protein